MIRAVLLSASVFYAATGLYLMIAPELFYLRVPGVDLTGPYNGHFLRDVGLAFCVSAGVLGWGASTMARPLMVAGALWPAAHGAFHLQIWAAGGCGLDPVSVMDLTTIVVPSFLTLALALVLALGAARRLGEDQMNGAR